MYQRRGVKKIFKLNLTLYNFFNDLTPPCLREQPGVRQLAKMPQRTHQPADLIERVRCFTKGVSEKFVPEPSRDLILQDLL